MTFWTRTTCRSCNSENLTSILSLGVLYISNFVDIDAPEEGPKAPLELILCKYCKLVQLRHTTSPDLLWKHYWYRSGMNNTMRAALADVTEKAETLVPLSVGDLVLDIGCNDGTLLRSYRSKGLRLMGFEPASNLIEDAEVGTTKIINDYFNFKAFEANFGDAKAKIITSIAMFYDLEDPNAFLADVCKCLDENGVWVIQMNYLPTMLEQNAFDNIGHEHLEYYSLTALRNLLARHELEIFDVELNEINGGSFRIYVSHPRASLKALPGSEERLCNVDNIEQRMGLMSSPIYEDFSGRVTDIKRRVREFVIKEVAQGETIYVYGASTRGSTLLQFFGLDSRFIKAAVEKSPFKWGKKTTGTWIPIISEERARAEKPDYFLILPYFFLDEFREREREYLASGGKFIVPLPHLQIISG